MSCIIKDHFEIAVIGAGAAGVMAALRGVLNNDSVLLFTGTTKDKKKSRAQWVYRVENMPGFHGYKKAIHDPNKETLDWIEHSAFCQKLTKLDNVGVTSIKKENDLFEIAGSDGQVYFSKYVVLCTGIMDVQPHFQNSIKPILPYANAQTVDYCLRCDGHHVLGKHSAVIGSDDSAAWVAVMLFERYNPPSMKIFTNGAEVNISADVMKLVELYNIEIIVDEIVEVVGDKRSGSLEGFKLKNESVVKCEFSFISLGTIVYNELAKNLGAEIDKRGYVIADGKGETSVSNFFVAGDIKAGHKKQIYTAWDMAVDTLDEINRRIRLEKRNKLLGDMNV